MSINKSYAVFGMGRYGFAVAKELLKNGAEVLAVDKNEDVINSAVSVLPLCKCADITDAEAIKQLGISNFDVVIIAMASSFEASVMATMLCKEAGVGNIIVKCANEMHCKILNRVGATKVVLPESESGVRLAKNLLSSGFVDIMELSDDVSLIELEVKPEWEGRSILAINFRKKYAINIVALRRGNEVTTAVDPEAPLDGSMKLIVIANTGIINKLR